MTALITNGVGLIKRTTNVSVIVKVMAKTRIHITKMEVLVVTEKVKAVAKEQMPPPKKIKLRTFL